MKNMFLKKNKMISGPLMKTNCFIKILKNTSVEQIITVASPFYFMLVLCLTIHAQQTSSVKSEPSNRDASNVIHKTSPGCPCESETSHIRISIIPSDSEQIVSFNPDIFESGNALLFWDGNLNTDTKKDLIVFFPDMSGNWGEFLFLVLAGCGDSIFIPIWGPEYAQTIEIKKTMHSVGYDKWHDLKQILRDDSGSSQRIQKNILQFKKCTYIFKP